jgi:hypothetical protein
VDSYERRDEPSSSIGGLEFLGKFRDCFSRTDP